MEPLSPLLQRLFQVSFTRGPGSHFSSSFPFQETHIHEDMRECDFQVNIRYGKGSSITRAHF